LIRRCRCSCWWRFTEHHGPVGRGFSKTIHFSKGSRLPVKLFGLRLSWKVKVSRLSESLPKSVAFKVPRRRLPGPVSRGYTADLRTGLVRVTGD
jgi:hypothetical protein